MKALVKKDDIRVYDIVENGSEFETEASFIWVDISDELANESGIEYNPETGTISIVHKFIPGGNPKVEKEIKMREAVVEFNNTIFQADQSSQDALSRNILAGVSFVFLDVENNKISFEISEAKQLLKLMTEKTLQIIEEYQARKQELYSMGFTARDIGIIPTTTEIDQ
jgi:hypothetical protein